MQTAENITDLLAAGGNNTLVVTGDGKKLTYRQVLDKVYAITNYLESKGVKRGSTIGVALPSSPETLAVMLACANYFTLDIINLNRPKSELEQIISSDGVDCLLHDGNLPVDLRRNIASAGIKDVGFSDLKANAVDSQPVLESPVTPRRTVILRSSGTSSHPKTLAFDMHGLLTTANDVASQYKLNETDVGYINLDHHLAFVSATGLMAFILPVLASKSAVYLGNDAPDKTTTAFIKAAENGTSWMLTTGSGLLDLDKKLESQGGGIKSALEESNIRFIRVCGTRTTLPFIKRLSSLAPENVEIIPGEGMSEIGPLFSHSTTPKDISDFGNFGSGLGFLGIPTAGVELKIVDENNHPVKKGQHGDLMIKSPRLFREMIGHSENGLDRDGFYRTGDIVVQNPENGHYYHVSRDKEIIRSHARCMNFAPGQLEEAVLSSAKIAKCIVFGVPFTQTDSGLDDCKVVVAIEPKDFATDPTQLKDELTSLITGKLGAKYAPDMFVIAKMRDYDGTQKVSRQDLPRIFNVTSSDEGVVCRGEVAVTGTHTASVRMA